MNEQPLVHEVPITLLQRAIIFAFGLFPLIAAPYELWRGIWPPNLLSLFFGLFVGIAVTFGATLIWSSLFGASLLLEFRPGELTVREQSPWSKRSTRYGREDILVISVRKSISSDGPDNWWVDIALRNGRTVSSRPFGSQALAEQHAAEFRAALNAGDAAAPLH